MDGGTSDARTPRFTIVSAVHNVARYLPDFVASIDNQTISPAEVQVVVVDDGSTDQSLAVLEEWRRRAPDRVTVLSQANGGQASARNLGLDYAVGEWVTFIDPDDMVEPSYLSRIDEFLRSAATTPDLVVANLLIHDESRNRVVDSHPLRGRFRRGSRVVSLNDAPDNFQLSLASAFVQRGALLTSGLRFDVRVRPNFEDGHLIARLLLHRPNPQVGIVPGARYYYRRRADMTSTLQMASGTVDKYTSLLRFGYLDVLDDASRRWGRVPEWLQNTIIYELGWLIGGAESMNAPADAEALGVADQFHDLMRRVTEYLDPGVVERFDVMVLSASTVAVIGHAYRGRTWHQSPLGLGDWDRDQRLVRLTYLFAGPPPAERVTSLQQDLPIIYGKNRAIVYSGRPLVHERIAWVPAAVGITVHLDGTPVEAQLDTSSRGLAGGVVDRWRVVVPRVRGSRDSSDLRPAVEVARDSARLLRDQVRSTRGRIARKRTARSGAANLYRDAWLLMDRDMNARDNAEHLFRYLRANHPEINAWFTIRREAPDFERMSAAGLDHLVAYGSPQWRDLCMAAVHLISSHADEYVIHPPALAPFGALSWRFTFLQHGVTQNDISVWLNTKPIDVMIAASALEHEALAGEGSPYRLTTKEVALAGFPRHDRLVEMASRGAERPPSSILVMPTWRQSLLGPLMPGSSERHRIRGFRATTFGRAWSLLLGSSRLAELARSAGLEVVFMPHPNLAPYLQDFGLPPWIRVVSYATEDVQKLLTGAGVVVTDYSSVAFDAALVGRPVVYYQFDRPVMFGGGHLTRPGYFSYPEDGFGPVVDTLDDALVAIESALAAGRPPEIYQERVAKAFPYRNGGNCARVVKAIQASVQPRSAHGEWGSSG